MLHIQTIDSAIESINQYDAWHSGAICLQLRQNLQAIRTETAFSYHFLDA